MKLKYTGSKPYTDSHGIRTFHPGVTYDGVPGPLGRELVKAGLAAEVKPKGKARKAAQAPEANKATGPEETK